MKKIEAKIVHLYHSGFAIETTNNLLIFDYFQDQVDANSPPSLASGIITKDVLSTDKNIYVFVTHSHRDHYNPVIFTWESINPKIQYILSHDIHIAATKENYHFMEPYQELHLKDLKIKSYGTTDLGVSYLAMVDKFNIFHAGDLNWWHWKSFTKEQQLQEELDYKQEIIKIKEDIDIAFSPVDPRLEENFYLGGLYLAQLLQPKLLVPMHFGDDFLITKKFSEKLEDYPVNPAIINNRGQEIIFAKYVNQLY